jgi:hypothetical protein
MEWWYVITTNGGLIVGQALWYEHAASSLIMETMKIRNGVWLDLDRTFPSAEIDNGCASGLEAVGGS